MSCGPGDVSSTTTGFRTVPVSSCQAPGTAAEDLRLGGLLGCPSPPPREAFPFPTVGVDIPFRQWGQVSCSFNHAVMQFSWNQCLHGRTVTWSPTSTASIHIEHSALPLSSSMSISTFFFGNERMAASEAGPGALLPWFCSIS